MRVLLTGAGGFLGNRIAASLKASGVERIRLQYRHGRPVLLETADAAVEGVQANLLHRATLPPLLEGVDCVIHAAAGMKGATADMFLNTVLATRNLLDAAVAVGVRRIVLVSSFAVYQSGALPRGAVLDERCPLEPTGVEKGAYGYAKTRQEALFREYAGRHGFESVVLRPGVIYGPGGAALSPRVGIRAFGRFFSLGGGATLPLTYVDNCADAIVAAALRAAPGSAFSVVDDDLPSCASYLGEYRRQVEPLRVVRVPYPALLLGARLMQWYNRRSLGQLPAILTPYTVRAMFRPLRYSNAALKAIGWRPRVATAEGLGVTMRALARSQAGPAA